VRGPVVVIVVLAFCLLGFAATVWNYQRNHPFTSDAHIEGSGKNARVVARFHDSNRIQVGQRVVVKITGDSAEARGGRIDSADNVGHASIELDSAPDSPAGTSATVSVDGTLAPQPPASR
jgi:multidrug resistance efflux pump